MERLEPIPTPPDHRLRSFRHRLLPILAFLAAIGAAATLWP